MASGEQTVLLIEDWPISNVEQSDLTGDRIPELIVQQFSRGAHCCFRLVVFSRTPSLRTLVRWDLGNAGIRETKDLDGDGALEIVGAYDGFAYYDYCYAVSPFIPMVLRYDGQHFVDASARYPDLLRKDLEQARRDLLQGRRKGERADWWQQRYRSLLTALYADASLLGKAESQYAWVKANRPKDEVRWLSRHRASIERILTKRAERLSYPPPPRGEGEPQRGLHPEGSP